MTVSTKNFHPDTDRKLLCTCGNSGCDKQSVNQETLDALQQVLTPTALYFKFCFR